MIKKVAMDLARKKTTGCGKRAATGELRRRCLDGVVSEKTVLLNRHCGELYFICESAAFSQELREKQKP